MDENCSHLLDNNTIDYAIFHTGNETIWLSGLISILLLLIILVLELYYICCYKSNFILRLFFYDTIAATAGNAAIFISSFCTPEYIYIYGIVAYNYIVLIELIFLSSIEITLTTKIYTSIAGRHQNIISKLTLPCIRHPKISEAVFVIVLIVLPTPIAIATLVLNLNENSVLKISWLRMICTPSIIVSIVSIFIIIWFLYVLRKKNLLKNKTKQVCKEISLMIWVSFILTFWFLIEVTIAGPENPPPNYIFFINAIACFAQVFIPAGLFIYILTTVKEQINKRNSSVKVGGGDGSNVHTVPPSTRVSLPTDTAAHAPNFLSPSTAESSEVTSLLSKMGSTQC